VKTIRGLSKLIGLLQTACRVVAVFGPGIRTFVPDSRKSDYDTALGYITSACTIIQSIDYQDNVSGSQPPWGIKN